ncbi:hypothetical protein [Cohnella hongkongensis]|uniref:DUF5643 domain-containing protein n=1 Tax=Cohnella hongkongensis TaxID=178337 RepID=A0ABV9FD11_9BACL
MEIIKRHAALPALAAAIAILIALGTAAYGAKDNGTFEIRDLSGSREAIRNVTIRGELRDGAHLSSFRVADGRIEADTKLLEQPQWADVYRYVPGRSKRFGDMEFSVADTSTLHTITSRRMTNKGYTIPEGMAEVTPPSQRRKPEGQDEGTKLANPPEYGLAVIGGSVYYTVPVSTQFVGSSAIYELTFYPWSFRPMDPEDYVSRAIVDIPLDANERETGENPGIEVLGLEAVGDRLALISAEDGALRVRSYDGKSGELLGEAAVPDFYLPARADDSRPADAVSYYEGYEAYPDHDRLTLTLNFRRGSSTAERTDMTAFSFDFAGGVELAGRSELSFADGEEDTYNGVSHLSYRDGKLYALRSFRSAETEEPRVLYEIARSKSLYLYVYDGAQLIYKGEIVTDLNEDNIRVYNLSPAQGSFGYSQLEYRFFTNIAVE